jgi:LemA protein
VLLLLILLAVVLAIVLWVVATYNGLVKKRNIVDNSYSQIDVQLKQRHDLVPNLVETVKGYAAHESGVFQEVAEARGAAMGASGPAAAFAAENLLTGALGRLMAVAEAYPELRASENFLKLQEELGALEKKIAVARQLYNDTVLTYNNAVQTFPSSLLASAFGFHKREFFEADAGDRAAATVSF